MSFLIRGDCFDVPCWHSEDGAELASMEGEVLTEKGYVELFREVRSPDPEEIRPLRNFLDQWISAPSLHQVRGLGESSPEIWSLVLLRQIDTVKSLVRKAEKWNEALRVVAEQREELEAGGAPKKAIEAVKLKADAAAKITAADCCMLDFLPVVVGRLSLFLASLSDASLNDASLDIKFLENRVNHLVSCEKKLKRCAQFHRLYATALGKVHPGQIFLLHEVAANRRLNPDFQRRGVKALVYTSPYNSCARFGRWTEGPMKDKPFLRHVIRGQNLKRRPAGPRIMSYYSPMNINIKGLLPRGLTDADKEACQMRFEKEMCISVYQVPKGGLQGKEGFPVLSNVLTSKLVGHLNLRAIPLDKVSLPPTGPGSGPRQLMCSAEAAYSIALALQKVHAVLKRDGYESGVTHPFGEREDIPSITPARLVELGNQYGWLKPWSYPEFFTTVFEVPEETYGA